MALPPRPGGLVPAWARQQPSITRGAPTPPPDDPIETQGTGSRFRSVTNADGDPVELRGDHGGEPHEIPAGLDGLGKMRPSKLLARYQALLAEPVVSYDEDIDADGTVIARRPAGRGMHLELAAHAGGVPQAIREAAIEKLNEHEGAERYLLTDSGVRDLVREAEEAALEEEDRKAIALLGAADVEALLALAGPTAAERLLLGDSGEASRAPNVADAEFEPVDEGDMDRREDTSDPDPLPDTETAEAPKPVSVRWYQRVAATLMLRFLFLRAWLRGGL